jgi:hypothetical protein
VPQNTSGKNSIAKIGDEKTMTLAQSPRGQWQH